LRNAPLPACTLPRFLLAVTLLSPFLPGRAYAQNPGYFIPPSSRPATPAARPPAPRVAPRAEPAQEPALEPLAPAPVPEPAGPPPVTMPLPPVPDLPALPRAASPPTAVIGVLGVPEVMAASTAAQQVQTAIGQRRQKLNEDAQKEQSAWRELSQELTNPHNGLKPDQLRVKERDLQARIAKAQRDFRDRNRQIEEAGQFALAQIERTLIGVIHQVAESRGINLVLHRTQVALNTNEFDVTQQVADELNRVLPKVEIPAEGLNIAVPAPPPPPTPPAPTPAPAAEPAPATPAPARP